MGELSGCVSEEVFSKTFSQGARISVSRLIAEPTLMFWSVPRSVE